MSEDVGKGVIVSSVKRKAKLPKLETALPPKRVSKVPNWTESCKFPKRRPNGRQAKLKKIQKLPTWKASKQNNVEASKTPGNNYRFKENKEGNNKIKTVSKTH